MALNYSAFLQQQPTGATGISRALSLSQMMDKQNLYAQQQAELQRKQEEAQAMKMRLSSLARNPNVKPSDYIETMVEFPSLAAGLKVPLEQLNTQQAATRQTQALNVFSALEAGQTNVATDMLRDQLMAAENSGTPQDVASAKAMLELVQTRPEAAKVSAGLYLAQSMGPEKFAETWQKLRQDWREQELQPGAIKQQAADLGLTQAQINKEIINAKKIAADLRKTNLEANKVAVQIVGEQMKLKKEAQNTGVDLSATAEKAINDSVVTQMNNISLAQQYESLAKGIDAEMAAGATAKAGEAAKSVFGTEDEVTRLRQEYRRLRNSQVLQSLPPGVASDKDIEVAMSAFPSDFSNPELISSFLKGVAKLNRYEAQVSGAKAEWLSNNGTLGNAKRDFTLMGQQVGKGASFADVVNSITVVPSPIEGKGQPLAVETGMPSEAANAALAAQKAEAAAAPAAGQGAAAPATGDLVMPANISASDRDLWTGNYYTDDDKRFLIEFYQSQSGAK